MSGIDNFGDKRKSGNHGQGFQKGQSGNPGGRSSIANDLKRLNAAHPDLPGSTEEARQRWWAMLLPVAFAGPSGAGASGDPDWRYAAQEVGNRLLGKPKEHVEVTEGPSVQRPDFSGLSVEDRKNLLLLLRKAKRVSEGEEPDEPDAADDEPLAH